MAEIIENVVEDNATKAEKQVVNKKTTEKVETKYPLQDLIDASKALGYTKEVVAGAFFNTQIEEMTKSEFESTIKNFLGKKVK